MQQKREPRPGDYVITRASDTPEERADCRRTLRRNGCRSVRFEQRGDVLVAHGYLAALEGVDVESVSFEYV